MSKLSVEWDGKVLKISGVIDEMCDFSQYSKEFGEEVVVDLSEVTRINSCGVRQWIRGISGAANTLLVYENLPPVIVDQLSMVPEFGGENFKVKSFQAQYICEQCGHEEIKVLEVGKDIQPGEEEYEDGPSFKCPKCEDDMDFDHSPEVYLSFLSDIEK